MCLLCSFDCLRFGFAGVLLSFSVEFESGKSASCAAAGLRLFGSNLRLDGLLDMLGSNMSDNLAGSKVAYCNAQIVCQRAVGLLRKSCAEHY